MTAVVYCVVEDILDYFYNYSCICLVSGTTRRLQHSITDINQWMSAYRVRLNPGKMDLLWSGSKHSLCRLGGCGPAITHGTDTIKASGHVRVLGVTM